MQRSKSYRKAAELIDASKLYEPAEAIKLAKETSPTKFDATVEVAMRLGIDPRKADQMVRGVVNLPHGTGKTARVIVFAQGAKAEEAVAAGADEVGTDELVARIQGGWLDFDARRPARSPWTWPRPCPTSRAARSPSGWTSTPTCT
jgi:large subunit ribosomal protein L1